MSRPRRFAHNMTLLAAAVLGLSLVSLAAWPAKAPPRDPMSLLLWAAPQRSHFMGLRLAAIVAVVLSVAAAIVRGRHRPRLLIIWGVTMAIAVVVFGERFAGIWRAYRLTQ